ncbi:MAG TPA: hypothetical protein ENK10_06610 [Acidobacteria bacterium]|nr:hypothetical protein [Acidobacteriota bacterium]
MSASGRRLGPGVPTLVRRLRFVDENTLARETVEASAGSCAPDGGARTPDRDAGIAAAAATCP